MKNIFLLLANSLWASKELYKWDYILIKTDIKASKTKVITT
jgi:hypothetical protein